MNQKTITLQVGNSDDKLPQSEWSAFLETLREDIRTYALEIHFAGGSETSAPWQNYAWVFNCLVEDAEILRENVTETRRFYRQDSLAWTEGETAFI